ncbi:hypothetical protein GLOIN_2v1842735 [Rhizophagus clarus]|nr:hypothetical protein GLOIN_2v1842735 [Rhizophagus clarus]
MEIILEYTYTGSIKEKTLTKDNIIQAFYAADYFQFTDLQNFIMKTIKNTDFAKNCAPELLSKVSEETSLTEDNILLDLLVETVANIPLNNIEFGRLSIAGLKRLLSRTYKKVTSFVTSEYEVFRHSAILAAKEVSNDAYENLVKQLPTLEQLENTNSIKVEDKSTDHQKVAEKFEPLTKFIEFNQIKARILIEIIEPLDIIPFEVIVEVYRRKALSLSDLYSDGIRGKPQKTIEYIDYIWDESACGTNLTVENDKKTVSSSNSAQQSVRAKVALGNKGVFEWDVIIERACSASWVGVCASNLNYESWAGSQATGWILGSDGSCYHSGIKTSKYCPPFGDSTRITVHLDMNKKTCSFTVNGSRYPEVSKWNNLPSKLYPVVSLRSPGRFRIQPHCKNLCRCMVQDL